MRNRKAVVSMLAVGALAVSSACSDTAPTAPRTAVPEAAELFRTTAPPDPAAFSGGLDAIFAQIALEVPGFGGLFYDDEGALNVVMSGGARPMSGHATMSALSGWLPELGIDRAARQITIRTGDYDFLQLRAMRSRADAVFGLRGVVFTDADERANRVHIGVEDEAARASVVHTLAMLDVPREAVIISITEPEHPMQGLRDRVRPVAGGLQINFPGFLCTLGFNVRSPQAPNVHGFVTNSHCTGTRGTVTQTPYWQPSGSIPSPADPNFIGNEAHDIPYFTTAPCPAGNLCRWSDAAGVRYAPAIENAFGRIYRPTAIGSLTIDPATPMFNIVSERGRTIVGDPVNKVGRTTGWSSGSTTSSCVNVGVAGTTPQVVMLCQDRFTMTPGTQGGDSGSPMFQRLTDNDVQLVGILWGGTTFSPMENVRFENQGPAPWITYPGQTPPAPPGGPPASP